MKTLIAALLAAILLPTSPALAESPATSPVIGHWSLQVDKLTTPPETHPKRVDLDFHDAGDGKIATHVVIVDRNDHAMESQSVLSLDGTPAMRTAFFARAPESPDGLQSAIRP
jgi:hypothetical protein